MPRLPPPAALTALAAAVVAGAASLYQGAAVHDSAWVFRLAVGVALLASAAHLRPAPGLHVRFVVAAACVAAAWGLWRAPHLFAGLEGAAGLVVAAAVFGTLACLPRRERARWLGACVAVAGVHAAWAVAQRTGGATTRGHGGFFNPNDLAALAAPAALLAAATAVGPSRRHGLVRSFAAALAVTLAAGVWASGSRSGVLALAAGTLGMCCTRRPRRRRQTARVRRRRAASVAFASLVVASVAAAALVQRARNDADDPYAFGRLAIWRTGLAALRSHPLGLGFGGVGEALAARGVPMAGPVRYPALAHNAHGEWLQAALELGAAAPLVGAAPLALAYALARRRRWAQLGTWLSFALPAATGAPLHQPPVALLAVSWAAWAWPAGARVAAAATGLDLEAEGAADGRRAGVRPGHHRHAAPGGPRHAAWWPRLLRGSRPRARVLRARGRLARRRVGGARAAPRGRTAASTRVALGLGLAAVLVATLPNALGRAFAARGQALLRCGQPEQALAWMQRACAAAPWDVGHLVHRADVAARAAAAPEASVAAYRALAAAFPNRPEPWQRLAEALQAHAQGPEASRAAAEAWDHAARLRPTVALLWVQAGEAFARAGEAARAERAFAAALDPEPHCARAHFGRAALAHEGGRNETRARAARRALRAHALAPGPSAYAREVLALSDAAVATARSWAGAGWPDAPNKGDDLDDETDTQPKGPR